MSDRKHAFDYVNQYQRDNYDRITFVRRKGEKDKLTAIAKSKGFHSLSEFINAAIEEKLKRLKASLD